MDSVNPCEKPLEQSLGEIERVRQRYERRRKLPEAALYSPLLPSAYMARQEKERALIRWIGTCGTTPVHQKRLLEIGCGNGSSLLQFIRLGFLPENLVGNELRQERAELAR